MILYKLKISELSSLFMEFRGVKGVKGKSQSLTRKGVLRGSLGFTLDTLDTLDTLRILHTLHTHPWPSITPNTPPKSLPLYYLP